MIKNLYKLVIIVIISSIFSSCLSVDRKIIINKDGSGEETLKITFLKEFYTAIGSMATLMDSTRRQGFLDSLYSDEIFMSKTRSQYDSIIGIKVIDLFATKNVDSSKSFTIKYQFDSIKKIGSALGSLKNDNNDNNKSNSHKDPEANVKFSKEDNNIVFSYVFEQQPPEGMPANDSTSENMKKGMSELFRGGVINFEIDFPYEIISSNATSSAGNRLIWNYPLSKVFMSGKMDLEAVMSEK